LVALAWSAGTASANSVKPNPIANNPKMDSKVKPNSAELTTAKAMLMPLILSPQSI
jgi:hypothetical protein